MGWWTIVAELELQVQPAILFYGVDKSFGTLPVFRHLSLTPSAGTAGIRVVVLARPSRRDQLRSQNLIEWCLKVLYRQQENMPDAIPIRLC